MSKIWLPIGTVVLVVVIFVGGRLILSSRNIGLVAPKNQAIQTKTSNIPSVSSSSGTLDKRVAELEFGVSDLLKQKGTTSTTPGSSQVDTDLEKRVKTLETALADIVTRITALEQGKTTTTATQTSISKAPAYIPLSWVASSVATDWTSIAGQEFTINPADYPGYTNMQFEVSLKIFQNGQAFARVEDKAAGTSILASEVSTTSQSYTWLTSSGFQLPSGSKTYRLQLKSLTGYSADVQNARIKVNF